MSEFPEPQGFHNSPTFVKSLSSNNDSYLEKCCEIYTEWADILRETHARLVELAPGYNIAQIKDKFGGLRYYWDAPVYWRGDDQFGVILPEYHDAWTEAIRLVANAEERSYNI